METCPIISKTTNKQKPIKSKIEQFENILRLKAQFLNNKAMLLI